MKKGESAGWMNLLPLTYGQQQSQKWAGAQGKYRKGLWQRGRNNMIWETKTEKHHALMGICHQKQSEKRERFIVKSSDQGVLEKMAEETKTRKQQ